jgi:hypothetical protein
MSHRVMPRCAFILRRERRWTPVRPVGDPRNVRTPPMFVKRAVMKISHHWVVVARVICATEPAELPMWPFERIIGAGSVSDAMEDHCVPVWTCG